MAVIAFILTLLLVVGLHEAGHALAARFFGVTIETISIGFGKALLRKRDKNGVEWVWALWPFGGYVRLKDSRSQSVDPSEYRSCFDKQPVFARCMILLAGVATNFLVAWIAFVFFFLLGYQQMQPVIKATVPDRLLTQADIRSGDRFISVAGKSTSSWQEVAMALIPQFGEKKVEIVVVSANKKSRHLLVDLSPHFSARGCSLFVCLGLVPDTSSDLVQTVKGRPLMAAVSKASEQLVTLTLFFLLLLKQLVTGAVPFALLLGPLGFFSLSISSFTQGLLVFISFIANLSLTVGLVNLLPVPGLDGASVLYALIEKTRGKAMSAEFELLLYRLAMILFYMMLIQLALNDILRYLPR